MNFERWEVYVNQKASKEIGPTVYVYAYTQVCGWCVCFVCVVVGSFMQSGQRKPFQKGEIWRKRILLWGRNSSPREHPMQKLRGKMVPGISEEAEVTMIE